MSEENLKRSKEEDISIHTFSASAAMVGVCLTVIGLFHISTQLKPIETAGDELLALDAIFFLTSCVLSYLSLRSRKFSRMFTLERFADYLFLAGLSLMAIICGLVAYEFI